MDGKVRVVFCSVVGNAFNCCLVTLGFELYKLCCSRADHGHGKIRNILNF
jgi:hypothetical protein